MTRTPADVSTFAQYLEDTPQGTFSDWVRSRSEPLWVRMVEHRFTKDIATDTLPPGALQRYLIFEHDFVEAAVTIAGYALVKAPSICEQIMLAEVLRGLTTDQLSYFDSVLAQLGVSDRERDPAGFPPGVLAFREGMLFMASHLGYEEVIGAVTAAEWMYHTWCADAQQKYPGDVVAAAWIDLHVAPSFADQVAWLRGQLDHYGPRLSPDRQERVAWAFRRALALEIDFHDAPYGDGMTELAYPTEGGHK